MSTIHGRQIGGGSPLKSLVIVDEKGEELFGVVVSEEVMLTATPDKVIVGETFASDYGVAVGEDTRTYHTTTASRLILPGEQFSIPLSNSNIYDYTKFQCVIVRFSSSYSSNAETFGITIDDSVFSATTTEKIADITKNSETKSIDLNIVNDSDNTYSIRYFTYRLDTEV